MSEYCTCRIQTGSERNPKGERVCETCGKPDRITVTYPQATPGGPQ